MKTYKSIKYSAVLFLVLFTGLNTFAQKLPSFLTDSLDHYVERGMQNWKIPAVAIAVVKDGKVLLVKGYGETALQNGHKVDGNTVFMIGSNTKAFTAYSLTKLVLDHDLSMSDPVRKVLPSLHIQDDWVSQHVDFTDILSHRMGYATFQGDFMYWDSDLTTQEVVHKFGQITPKYGFRERWGYTNAGYAVADLAIQKLSGKSWSNYLQQNIFDPLHMDHTTTDLAKIKANANAAKAYTYTEGELKQIHYSSIEGLEAAGAIGSSVNDLSHWVMAQMDSGKYNGQYVLSAKAIQITHMARAIISEINSPYRPTNFMLYGSGWFVQDYDGKRMVSHTGGVGGFVTSVTMIPSEQLGVVVLTNTDENSLYETAKLQIVDAMLGLPYFNYDSMAYHYAKQNRAQEDARITGLKDSANMHLKAALPLNKYVGIYQHPIYGTAVIQQAHGQLTIKLEHHPEIKATLNPLGENRFVCDFHDSVFGIHVFPFTVKDGKVKSFELSVNDFLERGHYTFTREE